MVEMGIEASIMQSIINGQKTVEGRLRTAKFVTLRTGDIIAFRQDTWENDRIVDSKPLIARAKVTETRFFDSFEDLFTVIDYKLLLPEAANQEAATEKYRQFYTFEQEKEHGVVAIRFEVIKN